MSVAAVRALHAKGHVTTLEEVANRYAGIAADDPILEPYLAMAKELDILIIARFLRLSKADIVRHHGP